MTPEQRIALEDAVFDAFPTIDMDVIESMTDQDLRELLAKDEPAKPEQPIEPRQQFYKPVVAKVEPQTLDEAFAVSNGRLMRRIVTRHTLGQFASETVHLAPTGDRVRFAGRLYRSSHLLHWLQTGQWVTRMSRAKAAPRFKAQVRIGAKVLHLGYFASKEERDAAVFAYKLGIFPNGSKNA